MTLEKQLARFSQDCVRVNADQWLLSLRNGSELTVAAQRDDGFLLLDAKTEVELNPDRLLSLVERSAELAGNVKFALWPDSRRIRVRSEFPLPEDGADARRVALHLQGMQSTLEVLHNWTAGEGGGANGGHAEGPPLDPAALEGVLKDAGWESHKRSGGALLADLETPGQFFQAEVQRVGEGARFRAGVCSGVNLMHDAQRSLPLFLLEIHAALRYSRTFLEHSGSGFAAGFEVRIDWMPNPAEAGHALAALSVACRRCARELDLLSKDASLASVYWAARGLPFSKKEQPHG